MIRRLFTTASVVSLMLGVAVGVLWVRSYYRAECVERVVYENELG